MVQPPKVIHLKFIPVEARMEWDDSGAESCWFVEFEYLKKCMHCKKLYFFQF